MINLETSLNNQKEQMQTEDQDTYSSLSYEVNFVISSLISAFQLLLSYKSYDQGLGTSSAIYANAFLMHCSFATYCFIKSRE